MKEQLDVLELFGGIGACTKALKNIGINVNVVDYVEIDKYACQSYNAINNTNFEPQDITKWNKNIDVDLICHGSPCFKAGTKIITEDGYKNIEDVKIGDYVLTHKNRFQKVLKTGYNDDKNIYKLQAQGMFDTYVTENHPYYIVSKTKKWNNILRNYESIYSEPYWKEVKDLVPYQDYIGINIPIVESNLYNLDEEICWLLGRYVADGHIRHNKRKNRVNSYQYNVVYSIGNEKIEDFKKHLKTYHASIYLHTKSCYRCVISSQSLVEFIEKMGFGKGAINKNIPMFILNLPIPLAQSFLEGYMSGDGCFTNNKYKATSISKNLIMKLQLLVAKVYKTSTNVYFTERPAKHKIEGRTVNQHNTYQLTYKLNSNSLHTLYDSKNNIIWYPVEKIINTNKLDKVYNLEIENDNSYTANNFIVHNCQDYSLSGKQMGGDEGSGTRSSLMYETVRIVEKLKPKYILWENVKNLLSKKHKHNFDNYINRLDELGYNSYYKVLNAADYGIPQHRERVYTVSIRKDIDDGNFKFPEPEPLQLRLKDILEENVDERYYLSQDIVNRYVENKKEDSKQRWKS